MNFYEKMRVHSTIKSEVLSQQTLDNWLCNTKSVFERNESGIKVAELESGDILKIFRVKSRLSSANFYSYGRSFCRNAIRLKTLGIPTVDVKALYILENSNTSLVIYKPLPGETIRSICNSGRMTPEIAAQLGRFISQVHAKGVYFRGLHLGNILLMPNGEMGLIDISEMTIFPWSLDLYRRLRNFARFWRSQSDKVAMNVECLDAMIRTYASRSGFPSTILQRRIRQLLI